MEAVRTQRKTIMFYFRCVISFKLRILRMYMLMSDPLYNRFVRYSVTVDNSITIVVSLIHYTYSQSKSVTLRSCDSSQIKK